MALTPEELSRLWTQYHERLLLVARAIGEPSEDAVQEAFVQLALQTETPREPMAWLVRVVRNQLFQWHRSGRRRQQREQQCVIGNPWFLSAEGMLDGEEVHRALQALDALLREIVVMRIWGELSFEQIGEAVGTSRATAHRRFSDALTQLRNQLSRSIEEEPR